MAYEFIPEETIASGVVRCAREEFDRAVLALSEGIRTDPVDAVHTARKAIKKERALLRLARGALPGDQRARDNARLRDVARTLSGARDADVMVQTVDKLSERFTGQLPASAFAAVRAGLQKSGAARRVKDDLATLAGAAVQELEDIRLQIDGSDLQSEGWTVIKTGLRRSYRRGRSALRDARAEPSTETLHAWRKRVKDHWYHLRLLAPVCGPIVAGAVQEADRLSDLLGDEHDLGVLAELLAQGSPDLTGADVDSLLPLIEHRREELQAEAWEIGRRLYVEKPRRFERRLYTLWQAGQTPRNLRTEIG